MPDKEFMGLIAMIRSIGVLTSTKSVKLYEDNIKSLLNNPQWLKKVVRRRKL